MCLSGCLASCLSIWLAICLSVYLASSACPVLYCTVLCCTLLCCPVLSCPILYCPFLCCPVPSHPVHPVPSCPILSCPVPSCPIRSHPFPSCAAYGFTQHVRSAVLVEREATSERAIRLRVRVADGHPPGMLGVRCGGFALGSRCDPHWVRIIRARPACRSRWQAR